MFKFVIGLVASVAIGVNAVGVNSDIPIAFHQLVTVEPNGDAVIRLTGYDYDGDVLTYKIQTAPKSGKLFQLSQVYSAYGYNPKSGIQINDGDTIVTGSNNRVYYQRPTPDSATNSKWDTFTFLVHDGKRKSNIANVTLVPPSGNLVGSNFLLGNEDWTITGNKAVTSAIFEPYSRGPQLSHYVLSTDDKINVQKSGGPDTSLWYFNAPSKFLGNLGISYGGYLKFTLSAFSGDFKNSNGNSNLVEIECSSCVGPIGKGIRLVFPINAAKGNFDGSTLGFSIPLDESKGWLKDPQNSLVAWTPPSRCDLIQVLSRLTAVRILGDWTSWYESVAIDDVAFINTKGKLPLCAQQLPDASICTCDRG